MDKSSIEERLNDELNEKENIIEKLEEELETIKYHDEWKWRHIRTLSKEENLGLPIPRLEIRYRTIDDYNLVADYALVYESLMGETTFCPLSATRCGTSFRYLEDLELPFRNGADIMNEMYILNLPGYRVANGKYKKIDLSDPSDLPSALRRKMEKRVNKK